MKRMKKSLPIVCLFLMASSLAMASGIKFQKLSLEEGLKKAKKENKAVFIDVFATWCGPCKYLTKKVFIDKELGDFINEHFIALKLDGELEDGESLMVDFDLNSYPTMLFLSADKKLLKKIVGAVSAEEILGGAQAVRFPENTAIFKMEEKFKAGNREREFLGEFISLSLNEDRDTEEIVDEFLGLFPDLKMTEENEFLIFCLGVEDLEDKRMTSFLDDIDSFHKLHGEMVETKITMVLVNIVHNAIDNTDKTIIDVDLSKVYDNYKSVFGEDSLTKQDLLVAMNELYDEEVD